MRLSWVAVLEMEEAENILKVNSVKNGITAEVEIVQFLEERLPVAVGKVEEFLNRPDQELRLFAATVIEVEKRSASLRQIQEPPLQVAQPNPDDLRHAGNIDLKGRETQETDVSYVDVIAFGKNVAH